MSPTKAIICFVIALFLIERTYSEDAEAREAHLGYLKTSGVIVDICVYEQEFIPSAVVVQDAIPSRTGTLIKRAVVTGVHKGNVTVGTKIEISATVMDPPEFLTKFKSVVEGELLTFCYFGESLPKPKNGRNIVDHNSLYFDRCKDEDVKAFLKELDANSKQNTPSEQSAAPNGP